MCRRGHVSGKWVDNGNCRPISNCEWTRSFNILMNKARDDASLCCCFLSGWLWGAYCTFFYFYAFTRWSIHYMPFIVYRTDRQTDSLTTSFLFFSLFLMVAVCLLGAVLYGQKRERATRVSKRPFMAPLWWSFREADNITYYNWIWHGRSLGHSVIQW